MLNEHQLREWVSKANGYTSDSRLCADGDVFIALKGEKNDGHQFVAGLLQKKILGAIVEKGFAKAAGLSDPRLLEVDSVHEAHRFLAAEFRRKFAGKVIAVGGSSGKTSTKEFLHQILSQKWKCFKTQASQNGELGIPKTLEQIQSGIDLAIVEVGIDAPGDMQRHASLVCPDIALLTSIGEEHLNLLQSVENVFLEEKILFDVTLRRGGICFAPSADAYLSRLKGQPQVHLISETQTEGMNLEHLPNAIAKQNARLAVAVARFLGMSEAELREAVKMLKLPDGRGVSYESAKGLLIADHYNSNPSSLRAALKNAQDLSVQRKCALNLYLGDMLDLGEQSAAMHAGLVADFSLLKASFALFVGPTWKTLETSLRQAMPQTQIAFAANSELANLPNSIWEKPSVHLVKGSRGIAMEKVLKKLQDNFS